MSSQNPSYNPTGYLGTNYTDPGQDYFKTRDPTANDIHFRVGSRWINTATNTFWVLGSVVNRVANWIVCGSGTLAVEGLLLDDGNTANPVGGIVRMHGSGTQGLTTSLTAPGEVTIDIVDAAQSFTLDDTSVVTPIAGDIRLAGYMPQGIATASPMPGQIIVTAANATAAQKGVVTIDAVSHGVLLGTATSNDISSTAVGTNGQLLKSNGAGLDPNWTVATYPTTINAGQTLFADINNRIVTTSFINVSPTGIVSTPYQSAISAYYSANVANVTGDGTTYPLIFDTEDYDLQGEYDNTTGIFTAATAGFYIITTNILMINIGAGHNVGNLQIRVNGNIDWQSQFNPAASREVFNQLSINACEVVLLAAGDTVNVLLQVSNSTLTVGINGATNIHTELQISKIG